MLSEDANVREGEKWIFHLSSSSGALGQCPAFPRIYALLKNWTDPSHAPPQGWTYQILTAWPGCQPPLLLCPWAVAMPTVPTPHGSLVCPCFPSCPRSPQNPAPYYLSKKQFGNDPNVHRYGRGRRASPHREYADVDDLPLEAPE